MNPDFIPVPHPEDIQFYQGIIDELPFAARQQAIDGYKSVFMEVYTDYSIVEYQRMNRARRTANLRLRSFKDKFAHCYAGYTNKLESSRPPM